MKIEGGLGDARRALRDGDGVHYALVEAVRERRDPTTRRLLAQAIRAERARQVALSASIMRMVENAAIRACYCLVPRA